MAVVLSIWIRGVPRWSVKVQNVLVASSAVAKVRWVERGVLSGVRGGSISAMGAPLNQMTSRFAESGFERVWVLWPQMLFESSTVDSRSCNSGE